MLFNYRYVTHDIEKFQAWIRHLVRDVWCRHGGAFSIDLLHEELKAVILDVYNTAEDHPRGNRGDLLYGPITRIDTIFQSSLDALQRNAFRDWFDFNNDIRALCANNPVVHAITYEDISNLDTALSEELKKFFDGLFDSVIKWKPVSDRSATMDAHYDAFVIENDGGKCPYCGYGDIKGWDHSTREAYDHFLPKATYPFNSINFKNLAPMCHECNSSYKLKRDPIRRIDPATRKNTSTRRKAFYSYSTVDPCVTLDMTLTVGDSDKFSPDDIVLAIESTDKNEEISSWKDIFGIEERYKAKCCAKNDGMVWLSRITEENQNYRLTPTQMLRAEIRAAESNPWSDANFLKKPFLLACEKARLF